VESEKEILADKIVALAARKWIKYRDVWDFKQLADRGLEPESGLVRDKAADYGMARRLEKYPELSDQWLSNAPAILQAIREQLPH
jgi:hypothetical protein